MCKHAFAVAVSGMATGALSQVLQTLPHASQEENSATSSTEVLQILTHIVQETSRRYQHRLGLCENKCATRATQSHGSSMSPSGLMATPLELGEATMGASRGEDIRSCRQDPSVVSISSLGGQQGATNVVPQTTAQEGGGGHQGHEMAPDAGIIINAHSKARLRCLVVMERKLERRQLHFENQMFLWQLGISKLGLERQGEKPTLQFSMGRRRGCSMGPQGAHERRGPKGPSAKVDLVCLRGCDGWVKSGSISKLEVGLWRQLPLLRGQALSHHQSEHSKKDALDPQEPCFRLSR